MKLHEFSAEHEDLSKPGFDELWELGEKVSSKILTFFDQMVPSPEELIERQLYVEAPKEFDTAPKPSPGTGPQFEDSKEKIGDCVKRPVKYGSTSSDSEGGMKAFRQRIVKSSSPKDAPELALPFVSIRWKTFDNSPAKDATVPSIPVSALRVSTRPNVAALDRDLPSLPDPNLDVLQEFDFDSFLQQDGESPNFDFAADGIDSISTALRKPYTPVHLCTASFKFTKEDNENRIQEEDKACDACIAHRARCDTAVPTCINCHVNNLECKYGGQARAEEQDNCYAAEEEPPLFINAKQFHRILKRREARQVLEEETYNRNKRRASDQGEKRTTGNTATIPASQASCSTTMTSLELPANTQGDAIIIPQHIVPIPTSLEHHIPAGILPVSLSPDEKRARSIAASARFRARRKAREREKIEQELKNRDEEATKAVKERPENSTVPHQSVHDILPQNIVQSYDPYTTVFLGPLTELPPKPLSQGAPTLQESSSTLEKPLSLSSSQESKLWWRSIAFTQLSNFAAFQVLRSEFATELSIFFDFAIDDEMLCKRISSDIKSFEERSFRNESQAAGFNEILEMRMNILRIVSTVDKQLGLQIAILGWSCVCTVLHVSRYPFQSSLLANTSDIHRSMITF